MDKLLLFFYIAVCNYSCIVLLLYLVDRKSLVDNDGGV